MSFFNVRAIAASACVSALLASCSTTPPTACTQQDFRLSPEERAARFRDVLKALNAGELLEVRGVDRDGAVVMTAKGICASPTEISWIPLAVTALSRHDFTKCEPPVIVITSACYVSKP